MPPIQQKRSKPNHKVVPKINLSSTDSFHDYIDSQYPHLLCYEKKSTFHLSITHKMNVRSDVSLSLYALPNNISQDQDVLSLLPTNDLCSRDAAAQRTTSIMPNMQQCAHSQSP